MMDTDALRPRLAERTISIWATGWATAEAGIARIAAGVTAEAEVAKAALASSNAGIACVTAGLKAAGIDAKDVWTTAISVSPRYTEPEKGRTETIGGYEASGHVSVTVRDVTRVGELLDRMLALGANHVTRVAFNVADPKRLEEEARTRAFETARRRASLYASWAGAKLGPVLSIAEHPTHGSMRTASFEEGDMPNCIEPGRRRLGVQVHVVFALQ
jgi:hypothetical protein